MKPVRAKRAKFCMQHGVKLQRLFSSLRLHYQSFAGSASCVSHLNTSACIRYDPGLAACVYSSEFSMLLAWVLASARMFAWQLVPLPAAP